VPAQVTIFGLLLRQELAARDKQLARLQREERLGSLKLRLASGKVLALAELRGSARAVVVAGSQQQVRCCGGRRRRSPSAASQPAVRPPCPCSSSRTRAPLPTALPPSAPPPGADRRRAAGR
jgi:hypothetical protein